MSRHEPRIALWQILLHAQEAITMLEGRTREDLDSDRMLGLALTRLLEIIAEAATRVPKEVQERYANLPWM